MRRIRLLSAIAILSGLAAWPAYAGPYEDGVKALQAGEFAVALDKWEKAATAGDAKCQYGMGYLYQFGLGIPADNTQAFGWYEKSAAQNDPDAEFALGLMYESGRAPERDLAKALNLYRHAAVGDRSLDAAFALARIYVRGQGVARDEREGVTWARRAAAAGHPGAQYLLGEAYEVGTVVPKDDVEAYYWYSAALAGDATVVHDSDLEYDPKAALDTLAKRMSPSDIVAAKAKLKKTPPPMLQLAGSAPLSGSAPTSGSAPMSGPAMPAPTPDRPAQTAPAPKPPVPEGTKG